MKSTIYLFLTSLIFVSFIVDAHPLGRKLKPIENGEEMILDDDFKFVMNADKPKRAHNARLRKGVYVAKLQNKKGTVYIGPNICLSMEHIKSGDKFDLECGIHISSDKKKWRYVTFDVVSESNPELAGAIAGPLAIPLSKLFEGKFKAKYMFSIVLNDLQEAFENDDQ